MPLKEEPKLYCCILDLLVFEIELLDCDFSQVNHLLLKVNIAGVVREISFNPSILHFHSDILVIKVYMHMVHPVMSTPAEVPTDDCCAISEARIAFNIPLDE